MVIVRLIIRLIDYLEDFPSYVRFVLGMMWLHAITPFKLLKDEIEYKHTIRKIKKDTRSSTYFKEEQ